ncbi:dedicator of cytokinesis protein 2-like [Dysidea avara]|uniref:dedicator of cytokinesis protein 2-like n=1 Tax=Dysidea avara TaxID=196820 RepID=UPI00331C5EE7
MFSRNPVWSPLTAPRLGIAVYNFVAKDGHQLSLQFGDLVQVVEKTSGWYRGFLYYQPSQQGIFPVSYVHLKSDISTGTVKRPKKLKHTDLVPQQKDHLALEIEETLREWKPYLWKLFVEGPQDDFQLLLQSMRDMLSYHQNVKAAKLEAAVKPKVTSKLDFINHKLGLNAVPRNTQGVVIDPQESSFHLLCETYKSRSEDIKRSVTGAGTLVYKKTTSVSMSYHLYLSVEEIDHPFPDDTELFFRLYDIEKKEYISEPFAFEIKRSGEKTGTSSFHLTNQSGVNHALFTDLGGKDIYLKQIFLVCHIVRTGGRMLYGEKKYSSNHSFRRPYGCAVFDILEILRGAVGETPESVYADEHHCFMPIFVCAGKDQEGDFASFHDSTIRSKTKGKSVDRQMTGISFLMRSYHGSYSDLCHDHPILATKNLHIIHKLGFPEIILPGDNRNDVYIILEKGEYDKGTKTAQRNIEVCVVVVKDSGELKQNAIVIAEGLPPVTEYHSTIYYHNNKPRWQEMLKLAIGIEELPHVHLRFTFRHLAKNENKDKADKTFSFAFFKVMRSDGSIISDGQHRLYVYKADHKKWLEPKAYLTQMASKEDVKQAQNTLTMSTTGSTQQLAPGQIGQNYHESFYISIMTCSTKLTQKIELLSLLKWRQEEKKLDKILKNLMNVDGEEMVKFLQDTLDSLFEILVQNAEAYRKLVFDVLVHIITLLAQQKYSHFLPVLDVYISRHFSATLAYKQLLYSIVEYARNANTMETEMLSKTLSALEYTFKFMVQSHILYSRNRNAEDPQFPNDLRAFFQAMNGMMALHTDQVAQIHEPQNVALLHLASVLPDIKHMFSKEESAKLVSDFLNSMRNRHHILPAGKLQFILNVLDSSVNFLQYPDSRAILIPTLVGHLMSFVNNTVLKENEFGDNSVRCMKAIGKILESLHICRERASSDVEFVRPLFNPLLSLCKLAEQGEQIQQLALINFVALLRLFSDKDFGQFLSSLKKTETLKQCIKDVFTLFLEMVKFSPYHAEWEAVHYIQNRVLLCTVRSFSVVLHKKFFDEKYFSKNLWQLFFSLCTTFITQPSLKVEELSDYKRYKSLTSFGDMRVEMSQHVSTVWLALDAHKPSFIPRIIVTVLEMSLVKQKDVRLKTIPLLFDIIVCEQHNSGNFKRVEKEIFDKMDSMFSAGQGDGEYKELFFDIMTEKCTTLRDEQLSKSITEFTQSMKHYIELILDYRNVPAGDSHKNKRMGCMLNLLNFYQNVDKEDLYIRYIYKLSELHEREQNWTEAGFTLLLHADKLKWTEDALMAEGKYPEQMERERKEQLYMEAIGFFNEGKTWECGIRLCKELAQLYEMEQFDYHKLAAILETEARFFKNIITELRIVEPEYFRVSYYGNGFPYFLRNKTFIHRGKPYQKLGAFISTLTNEFPTAQILTHNKPVDDEIKNSTGRHIQLCCVQPIEEKKDIFKGKNVDMNILKYYKVNDIRRFKFDRPFHKGTKDPKNEFATLWFERNTMTTSSSFPGVLNWFEVTESKMVELAPLEVAIETVESKNGDISSLVDEYSSNSSMDINPLSMLLNGVIDAAVQGGTVQYREIFLTPKYLTEHPEDAAPIEKLKTCLEQQTSLCRIGLDIHGSRITASLQGLHQKLEEMYKMMCSTAGTSQDQPEIRRKSASAKRPLPETPLQKAIIGHETKSATMAVMRKDRERTMSVMVDSGRGNRLSANFQQKSASVSAIPDSKHPFSPPLSEVCPVNEDTADSIYEMTTAPEDYEFVDPAKARASMLQQDDIYQVPSSLANQGAPKNSQNDVYGFDTLAPANSSQNDVYGFDKLAAPNSAPQNDIYGFDKLAAPKGSPQNDIYSFDKLTPTTTKSTTPRFPSPTSNRAKVQFSQADSDYSFDQLVPATPPKKGSGSSSSIKEDMHHVQFKCPEEQSDDGLVVKKDQQKKMSNTGYDTVPPPVLKSPSPLSDDDQEEYIEPIDEEILKGIKGEHQTYDRLSKDQTHDRIPGPPPPNTNQTPPKLPMKKKSFPVRDSSYELLGADESCPVDEKNTPTKSSSGDGAVAPRLPVKSRNSLIMDDGAPPLPVKQDSRGGNRNSISKDDIPPPLPNRNSLIMDDVPPLPMKQDGSLPSKPRPFRESRKGPSLPPRNQPSPDGKPVPKLRSGSQTAVSPVSQPNLVRNISQGKIQVESEYSVLEAVPSTNDIGPAPTAIRQPMANKPRLPSPPPPSLPPKSSSSAPSPVRPAPMIPSTQSPAQRPLPGLPMQSPAQRPLPEPPIQSPVRPAPMLPSSSQQLAPKPTLPPKTRTPTSGKPGFMNKVFKDRGESNA